MRQLRKRKNNPSNDTAPLEAEIAKLQSDAQAALQEALGLPKDAPVTHAMEDAFFATRRGQKYESLINLPLSFFYPCGLHLYLSVTRTLLFYTYRYLAFHSFLCPHFNTFPSTHSSYLFLLFSFVSALNFLFFYYY
jgi:hypothetical protein